MLLQVRHVAVVGAEKRVGVGFAFVPWPGAALDNEQLRITRFIKQRERLELKRRK